MDCDLKSPDAKLTRSSSLGNEKTCALAALAHQSWAFWGHHRNERYPEIERGRTCAVPEISVAKTFSPLAQFSFQVLAIPSKKKCLRRWELAPFSKENMPGTHA